MIVNLTPKFLIISALLLAGAARAEVKHVPVKSGLALRPGQSETVEIPSSEALEIGWRATQTRACATKCVSATNKSDKRAPAMAAAMGASAKYEPAGGKIRVEYANKGDIPVTLDVFKVVRTCTAAACAFLRGDPKTHELVFKIDEFKSIDTSPDGSYSTIAGVTTTGKDFTVKAVWWTDDRSAAFLCPRFIKGIVSRADPKEKYAPYILSGAALEGKDLILKSVDACVPKAPKYGAPDASVYR